MRQFEPERGKMGRTLLSHRHLLSIPWNLFPIKFILKAVSVRPDLNFSAEILTG